MTSSSTRVIIAIDFGTANSGCAFSVSDVDQFQSDIHLVDVGGTGKTKVPTMIVLQKEPPHDIVYFGGGALNNFDPDTQMLFHKFKMQLYDNPRAQELKPDIGNDMISTKIVIARCLEYFKNTALDQVKMNLDQNVTPNDVKWIVTIPAMWRESAKATMREAARIAGLISEVDADNFTLAYEPECAALSILAQHMDKLENRDKYLVFDCGGGTIDIAIHKLTKDGEKIAIQEVKATRGLDNGSTRIDKLFLEQIDQIFQGKVETVRNICCERFDFVANELERQKQTWKENGRLSVATTQFSNEVMAHLGSLKEAVTVFNEGVDDPDMKARAMGQRVNLSAKMMKHIFDLVIDPIAQLALELLQKNAGIKYLFVVGGFASCKYLRDRLQEAIDQSNSGATMLLVHNPSVAVVQGAVRYGIDQSVVKKRVVHETIGVETQMDWSLNMPVNWREWEAETQSWKVKHCFSRLVQVGEQVDSSKSVRRTFYPTSTESAFVKIKFFSCASKAIPQLTTDEGVGCIGEVEIPVQAGVPVEQNPVRIRVDVGGPQILAHVKSEAMDHEVISELKSDKN